MSLFKEIPPTAGLPLYAKDLFSLFKNKVVQGSLEEDFKNYLSLAYAQITYSGTAAFYFILETLKRLSARKTVVIPAYICPLVPLAIKRAGLKIVVCDINKDNFNFNLSDLKNLCLKNNDILAIVVVHLGGIPIDLEAIQRISLENHIFIIEDCAQSLGAMYQGKKVGTLGDFSFFSLCRGKGLTIYEGGVLATKEEVYSSEINAIIGQFAKNAFWSESLKLLELLGYWIFYRPELFWFVYRLPQLFWERQGQPLKAVSEYFSLDFGLHKVSGLRKAIGHASFWRLEKQIKQQRQRAALYIEKLRSIAGIKIITESAGNYATYPYLTILFDDPAKRQRAQRIFRNSRLGVSQIYVSAITDYDYLKDTIGNKVCLNARYLAEREITLSTSTFLREEDVNFIVDKIKGI